MMIFESLKLLRWTMALFGLLMGFGAAQSAVNVTMRADDPVLIPGQTTVVRVFAQIDPSIENAAGIFSWHVDVLNSDALVLVPDYDNLTMTPPHNNSGLSSLGATVGTHRLGIHNTFLGDDPEAGKSSPVELLAVQVTASQLGVTTLSVRAGTNPSIPDDFIVTPIVGELPISGGNYAAATAVLRVIPVSEALKFGISKVPGGAVELKFSPIAGFDHTVMFSADLSVGSWMPLSGAPHNSGSLTDPVADTPRRFYKVFVQKQ
jgi:hypothetical protein